MKLSITFCLILLSYFLNSCTESESLRLNDVNKGKSFAPFLDSLKEYSVSDSCPEIVNKTISFEIIHKSVANLDSLDIIVLFDYKQVYKGHYKSKISIKLPLCRRYNIGGLQYQMIDILLLDSISKKYYSWSTKDVYPLSDKEVSDVKIKLLPEKDFVYEDSIFYEIEID